MGFRAPRDCKEPIYPSSMALKSCINLSKEPLIQTRSPVLDRFDDGCEDAEMCGAADQLPGRGGGVRGLGVCGLGTRTLCLWDLGLPLPHRA